MRAERLRRTKDIALVRESGEMRSDRHFTLRSRRNGLDVVRVAIASPRSLGNAVRRTRAKRRVRGAIDRLLRDRPTAAGTDVLIVPRAPATTAPFDDLMDALARHLGAALA